MDMGIGYEMFIILYSYIYKLMGYKYIDINSN